MVTGWRAKPSSFFSELVPVDLVECLDRHFADDSDSLKLSSGEGYELLSFSHRMGPSSVTEKNAHAGLLPYVGSCVLYSHVTHAAVSPPAGGAAYLMWT